MAKEEKKEEGGGSGEEGKAPAAAAKAGNKKLIIIIAGAVLLLVGIGVPAILLLSKGESKPKANLEMEVNSADSEDKSLVPEGSDDEDEAQEQEEPLGAIFPFDSFVVNLNGGRFLRAQLQIEFVEREVPRKFHTRLVPARDALIMLLTNKTAEELSSVEGKDTLKREIRDLVNELMRKELVKNVYFTQFVVQ